MENDEKIVHIELDSWRDMGDATEFFNEFYEERKHEDEINYSEVWYDQASIFCITTTEQYAKEHHLTEHIINNLECDIFGCYYPKYDPEHFGVDYLGEYEGWAPYKEINAQLIKAIKEKEENNGE